MERAPFQVLVFPFRFPEFSSEVSYAIFRRSDTERACWQGIAGGGLPGETPATSAAREAAEEAGISRSTKLIALQSMATVPVVRVSGFLWGPSVAVIPEYAFGAEVGDAPLTLSHEHAEFRWMRYADAAALLTWDSNKNALWELNYLLTGQA